MSTAIYRRNTLALLKYIAENGGGGGGGTGATGATGVAGATGATGVQGAPGIPGSIAPQFSPTATYQSGAVVTFS